MGWPTHYLKANKATEIPTNLLFVDTESNGDERKRLNYESQRMTFRLGVATHVRLEAGEQRSSVTYRFKSPLEFWKIHRECEVPRKPLWCFAHNLHFDLTMLQFWHQLETCWFKVSTKYLQDNLPPEKQSKSYRGTLCLEDSPTFARVLGRMGTCWFVDSLNYFPKGLAKIGEDFGHPKLKWEGFDMQEDALFTYCENDVRILRDAMVSLLLAWQRNDCGQWKATAASLALTNYMHWHCDTREEVPNHTNRFNIRIDKEHPARQLERDAYYGGRIEAFFYGKRPAETQPTQRKLDYRPPPIEGPYYLIDVRSLYPAMMALYDFPQSRHAYVPECEPAALQTLCKHYGAVSRVLIDSGDETYPIRFKGRQIHASGRFVTELCGWELQRALHSCHVIACGETCLYKMAPLFRDWALHWWDTRRAAELAGDTPNAELAKLIMTSLSGKFAQRPERWADAEEVLCPTRWGQWRVPSLDRQSYRQFRAIGGWAQERVAGEDGPHVFPAISGFITSAARERMRWLMSIADPTNTYWIGTDALIVNRHGYDNLDRWKLIDGGALGKFALHHQADEVEILGSNAYQLGSYFRSAGLHGKRELGPDGHWKAQLWQRMPNTLSERPDGSIVVNVCDLEAMKPKPKGELLESGWVKPHHFSEPPVQYSREEMRGEKRRADVDM